MSITATPHINLRGAARDALAFYRNAFDGKLTVVTYQDAHNVRNPLDADRVMWGEVATADGLRVMVYDVPVDTPWSQGDGAYFVCVESKDVERINDSWTKLSAGAAIVQPISESAWAVCYGMLKDKFGVMWVLSVPRH